VGGVGRDVPAFVIAANREIDLICGHTRNK
jgi:hypothetical protein